LLIPVAAVLLMFTGAGARAARERVAPPSPGPASTSARSVASDTALVPIGAGDAGTRAFVAWPPGGAKAPIVLVAHEWWGLNAQIREVAMRLARQGYVAVVPDLYHGHVAADPMQAHELSRALSGADAARDMDGAAAWARKQPRAGAGPIGVVGFCLGGGVALQYALDRPEVGAVVMFYGSPEDDPARLARLRAPLQGHFGAEDQGIAPARAEQFRAALGHARKTADIYLYPGAGHAFMHDGLPSYRVDAARQAWARTLAFLQKHLKSE
jgi:carboxymethylenebutenolidase